MNYIYYDNYNIPSGAILAEDIYDRDGKIIAAKNTIITDSIKFILEKQPKKIKVKKYSYKNSKNKYFKLDDAIETSVTQGIQYIYTETNQKKDIVDVSHDIAIIMSSLVNNNEDISIVLNNLKTSDEYTFNHCLDVATISLLLAKNMRLNNTLIFDVIQSAILHDIGKTVIPNEILHAPRKLTNDEFEIIKKHPLFGYNMVKDSNSLSEKAKLGILMHHEQPTGFGYPLGLAGKQIGLIGKIISIADVFDALVTDRPYRYEKISNSRAVDIMIEMSSHFDINILRKFLSCIVVYNTDSLVTLSNKREAIVIGQNKGYPLRPILVTTDTGEEIDLLQRKNLYLTIV